MVPPREFIQDNNIVSGAFQVLFRSLKGPENDPKRTRFQPTRKGPEKDPFNFSADPKKTAGPKKTRKGPEKDPKKTRKGPEKDPKRTEQDLKKTRKGPDSFFQQTRRGPENDPKRTRRVSPDPLSMRQLERVSATRSFFTRGRGVWKGCPQGGLGRGVLGGVWGMGEGGKGEGEGWRAGFCEGPGGGGGLARSENPGPKFLGTSFARSAGKHCSQKQRRGPCGANFFDVTWTTCV